MRESSWKDEILSKAVEKLREKYRLHAVILFGSRARGDHKPWSDYDLLIIADFSERYLERFSQLFEVLDPKIEPHPYTLEEAIEMLKKGNVTIVDAIEEGIVLFSDESFEELIKVYEDLKRRGMRRSKVSIVLPEV